MASTSGPYKHRKAGSSISGRPVVPAIPLPYVKRQAAAAANRSANAKANSPATSTAPKNIITKDSDTEGGALVNETAANASPADGTNPKPLAEQATIPVNGQVANAQPNSDRDKAETAAQDATAPAQNGTSLHSEEDARMASIGSDANLAQPGASREHTNGHAMPEEVRNGELVVDESASAGSSSSTPSNQQELSTSGPNARPQSTGGEAPAPATMNGRYRLHQTHLGNNTTLHFEASNDSNASSPGLAAPGGFGPPSGFAASASHLRPAGQTGNGVPRVAPGVPEIMQGHILDNLGRPMMPFAPIDANHSLPNGLDPSTPRSIHGSQSSVQQDDTSAYQQQFSSAPPNGMSQEGAPPPFQSHIPPVMSHPPPMLHHASPLGPGYNGSPGLELLTFIQQAWLNGQYVDCVLEVRDRRGVADRIPAHHLVLAQSPVLNSRLLEQGLNPPAFGLRTRHPLALFLNTENKWFWIDSLKLIVQSLYGYPSPNPNPQGPLNELDASFLIGPPSRCLGVSLSYAAGGHLLGLNHIVTRGAELAARHVGPQTVDTAMAFALEEYTDKGTHEQFKYGAGSNILLQAIVGFVASNVSPSFNLDASATSDGMDYARLPYDSTPTPNSHGIEVKGSAVGHFSKGSNTQKQLNIQFGDLSVDTQGQDEDTLNATLSRVLLNLPFSSLKLMAEYGPEVTTDARVRAVQMAVREREARRLRALNAVLSGVTVNADAVREMLQSPEPKQYSNWGVLGWREELTHGADGPSLSRQWQPLRLTAQPSVAEYP